MRFKLTIAYDGFPYRGWQSQPGMVTVQETVEHALAEIAKEPIRIYASGRTDTGVHADGQVVHFDAPAGSRMTAENWISAVNTRLPKSVRVMDGEEVEDSFHARFSAVSKTYLYRIETGKVVHPHEANRVWHVPRGLDLEVLRESLATYIGTHDFRHFSARRGNETEETSYLRTLSEASLVTEGSLVHVTYCADGFLYKMVRLLTGVAVSAACGRIKVGQLHAMLSNLEETHNTAKLCAPADGLRLKKVVY